MIACLKSGDLWRLFLSWSNEDIAPSSVNLHPQQAGPFCKRADQCLCPNGEDTLMGECPGKFMDINTMYQSWWCWFTAPASAYRIRSWEVMLPQFDSVHPSPQHQHSLWSPFRALTKSSTKNSCQVTNPSDVRIIQSTHAKEKTELHQTKMAAFWVVSDFWLWLTPIFYFSGISLYLENIY